MNRHVSTALGLAGLSLIALGGCQTYPERSYFDPLNLQVEMQPRQVKAVQVAPAETAFTLQFPAGAGTVGEAERRAAEDFLKRRADAISDRIYVDFGFVGAQSDLLQERRMTIAEIIAGAGFDPANVLVRENFSGLADNAVNLTVERYLVTLPGCPDWTSRAGRTFDNRPNSNFGCATAINFGLMVAEPRDILEGRGGTPGDGEALSVGVQRYRVGETRALEVDNSNTADSFGVTGQSSSGGDSQ